MSIGTTHTDRDREIALAYYRLMDAARAAMSTFSVFLDRFGFKLLWTVLLWALLSVPYVLMEKADYTGQIDSNMNVFGLDAREARAAFWSDYFASMLTYDAIYTAAIQARAFFDLAFLICVTGFMATIGFYAIVRNPAQRDCSTGAVSIAAQGQSAVVNETVDQLPAYMVGVPRKRLPALILMMFLPLIPFGLDGAVYAMLLGGFVGFLLLRKEDGVVGRFVDRFIRYVGSKTQRQNTKASIES